MLRNVGSGFEPDRPYSKTRQRRQVGLDDLSTLRMQIPKVGSEAVSTSREVNAYSKRPGTELVEVWAVVAT